MRHPSEAFIKSLMVMGKTDDQVRTTLIEFGLPETTDEHVEYLVGLRLDVVNKLPKGYTGARDEDRDFLKKHQIDGLVHPDATVAQCASILARPHARRDIFMGLLGRIDAEDLARHVSRKHNVDVTFTHVRAIEHYYFNVNIVSPFDWFDIFGRMPSELEATGMNACFTGGPVVAAYRLGIERQVTIKEAVSEVVQALYTTLHEIRNEPASPAKLKMLSDTMGALAKAHSVLNTSDQELAAVASELRTLKLAKSNKKPIPLALLAKTKAGT